MSLVDKLKNILFDDIEEVEEDEKEIKIRQIQKGETKVNNFTDEKKIEVKFENKFNIPKELEEEFTEEKVKPKEDAKIGPITSNRNATERELFKSSNNFKFPEFDEEEFQTTVKKERIGEQGTSNIGSSRIQRNANALEYERKKILEKKNDRNRYERVSKVETTDKKKFQPSPIISPVYGVLYQDYVADDIVKRGEEKEVKKIDIDSVRKKAFESKVEKNKLEIAEEESGDDPVVTFFSEKETIKVNSNVDSLNSLDNEYKNLDNLLETASEEVDLEDTIEIPRVNNFDQIEEELNKFEEDEEEQKTDDCFDNELFDLIDSMYENREE